MATSNFYLYKADSTQETLIILHFRYGSKQKLAYSTRQKIHPKNWNAGKQRAKETESFKQGKDLNILLNRIENEAFNIYRRLLNNSENSLSNEAIKQEPHKFLNLSSNQVKTLKKTKICFYQLFDEFIQDSISGKRLQKDGRKIRPATIKRYVSAKNHFINFKLAKCFDIKLPVINNLTDEEKKEIKFIGRNYI